MIKTLLLAILSLLYFSPLRGDDTVTWPDPPLPPGANPAALGNAPVTAWLDHFAKCVNAARALPRLDVVCDGDNFTAFTYWDMKPSLLASRFPKLNFMDFGSMGETTQSILWRLQNGQMDGLHPRLILLLVGANNLTACTPEQTADGIKAVVAEYQKRCPNVPIVLGAVCPRGEKPTDPLRAKVKALDALIAPLGDGQKVIYVDISDKIAQPDGTISRAVLGDFVHFAPNGLKIWADAVQPSIEKFCPPPDASTPAVAASTSTLTPIGGTVNWHPPVLPAGANPAVIPSLPVGWIPHFEQNLVESRKQPVDLVFDGDSITYGWMGNGGMPIWKKRYAIHNAYDFGISGDSTSGLLWRVKSGQVAGLHPKLIVLLIGTNNMNSSSAEQIAGGIKAIVAEYQKQCPDAAILLQGIFPRGEQPTDPMRAKVKQVNQMISALGDGKKVIFLDFGDKLLDADGKYTKPITQDFLHPTGAGYQIWADAIQPVIDRFFPPAATATTAAPTPAPH
jgi:lysophospholipase L1-like esterase